MQLQSSKEFGLAHLNSEKLILHTGTESSAFQLLISTVVLGVSVVVFHQRQLISSGATTSPGWRKKDQRRKPNALADANCQCCV